MGLIALMLSGSDEDMEKRTYKSMLRAESYILLLYKTMMARGCSNRVLYSSDLSKSTNFYLLKKAIDARHICRGQYKEKYGQRYVGQEFFAITGDGLTYLSKHPLLGWFKYLPSGAFKISVFDDYHSDNVAATVRSGNALLMSLSAGAIHTDYIFTKEISTPSSALKDDPQRPSVISEDDLEIDPWNTEEDEEVVERIAPAAQSVVVMDDETENGQRSRLDSIMQQAHREASKAKVMPPPPRGADLYYFPRAEIRARIEEAGTKVDTRWTKIVGLLNGKKGSVVLYHARHDGISWNNTAEKMDIQTAITFSVKCAPYHNIFNGEVCAAILVYNKKNFGDILHNKWKMRSKGTTIGGWYRHVSLVPLGDDGARLLSELIDPDALRAYALETGRVMGLTDNGGTEKRGFPLTKNGISIFNGVPMDYKEISEAMAYAKKKTSKPESNFRIGVLCYEWQQPFYEIIWPEATFYIIEPMEES